MPHYLPKGPPIVFSCVLGDKVVKYIELKNPTNKPISYWVYKFEGDKNDTDYFKIEDKIVKLENVPVKFKISFQSRIS